MSEVIFICMLFGIPGIFGFIMARKRHKNPYLWGILSAIFPFFLLILKVHYKDHDHDQHQNNIVQPETKP